LGFIKGGTNLDQLSDCQLLEKGSIPLSVSRMKKRQKPSNFLKISAVPLKVGLKCRV
jgi:hypothetical protein